MYCLQCFTTEAILNRHKEAIKIPGKGKTIKFQNYHKQLQAPFVIYSDFEAITEKVSRCKPSNSDSYTETSQKHTDCSYAYKAVCCYHDRYTKPAQSFRGENAVYNFLEKMLPEVWYCQNAIKNKFKKPLNMTDDDEQDFKNATTCYICFKKIQRIR